MGFPAKLNRAYTYADYLQWPDDETCEIIDGVLYDMSPAPGRKHQEVVGELHRQIANFLFDKICRVYAAPFDVRLHEGGKRDERDITTVIQPDISIVCDPSKLDEKGCLGSPDLVMEIVSPNTVRKDMGEKFALYEKHGVMEYWIVHPVDQTVMVFVLDKDNKYGRPSVYSPDDKVNSSLFPDLVIELGAVFRS